MDVLRREAPLPCEALDMLRGGFLKDAPVLIAVWRDQRATDEVHFVQGLADVVMQLLAPLADLSLRGVNYIQCSVEKQKHGMDPC